MGPFFLEHLGGNRVYICGRCNAPLTNFNQLVSSRFRGSTGKAYLFKKVVNVYFGQMVEREMTTGRHFVRDTFCKRCRQKLGWMYEMAVEPGQGYKEGCVILEKALISRRMGIYEISDSD